MRILVAGATGYVGARLVTALVAAGHDVVAASSREPRPERGPFDRVSSVRMDAADPVQVRDAVRGVDAVVWLVHALDVRDFERRDRDAARTVARAVEEAGVRRVVYLSGLVPDVDEGRLSPHIASRLEVERVLGASDASTLSLRAGVVIGAGSTSFEIIRQLASVLLVHPVPPWLRARVQPVAVRDVVRALVHAVGSDREGEVDVGGPDVLPYAELLRIYCAVAGLPRVQVPTLGPPVTLAAVSAGLATAAPYWTVAALVQSLRHDMVCRPDHVDPSLLDPDDALPVREAIALALAEEGAAGLDDGDPDWVRFSRLERMVAATRLPGSTLLGSVLHVADHRTRRLLRWVRS
ncbi:MAG: NAD(P)H-binding protein [Nocardioidaceae bacterium]|nr:NAD(P)H-binding protein [Nocardioidaceae bacterium]